MKFKLVISMCGNIMNVKVLGNIETHADGLEFLKQYMHIRAERKAIFSLVDIRNLNGRLDFGSIFELSQEAHTMAMTGLNPYQRGATAILDKPEHHEVASFHEITASNAGTNLKSFTDINDAMDWLNNEHQMQIG